MCPCVGSVDLAVLGRRRSGPRRRARRLPHGGRRRVGRGRGRHDGEERPGALPGPPRGAAGRPLPARRRRRRRRHDEGHPPGRRAQHRASGRTCSSAGRRASRSPSRGSGWTGSATASTPPPACCRRTPECSPRPSRGSSSSRTSTRSRSTTRPAARPSSGCSRRSRLPATSTSWQVLNAADYGVPQARPRLFIVGSRKREKLPELPEANPPRDSGSDARPTGGPLPHVTTGEALAGLVTEPEPEEVVRGRWGHLLPEIPPGENYLHFTAERGHPDPLFEWRVAVLVVPAEARPRPSPRPPSRPSPGPTSARSTGRTAASGCPSSAGCSRSPTTSRSSGGADPSKRRSATPCRRCSPSASPSASRSPPLAVEPHRRTVGSPARRPRFAKLSAWRRRC